MKKIILVSLILCLPSIAQAELVKLEAGFSFMRCEKVGEDTVCGRAQRSLEALEIDLNTPTDEGALWGEVRFLTSEDGVDFEGTIEVKKIMEGETQRYEMEIYVASVIASDPASLAFDFIGMTTLKGDFSRLNETVFTGRQVKTEKVDLTPFLTIRPL